MSNETKIQPRLATLAELREKVLPAFLSPIPTNKTLASWFDAAKVARFKSNPVARRGGGAVFYSVAGVEKFFRQRMGAAS
jgi:trehalose utilization protein